MSNNQQSREYNIFIFRYTYFITQRSPLARSMTYTKKIKGYIGNVLLFPRPHGICWSVGFFKSSALNRTSSVHPEDAKQSVSQSSRILKHVEVLKIVKLSQFLRVMFVILPFAPISKQVLYKILKYV